MKLPVRITLSVTACAALFLGGCSAGDNGAESGEQPASRSADAAEATGGACAVTVVGDAPQSGAAPDAVASASALESVEVVGSVDSAPTATFEAPLAITDDVATAAEEGSGDAVTEGDLVTFDYLICDANTGEKLTSTWGADGADNTPTTLEVAEANFGPALTDVLKAQKVGAQVLWGVPGASAEASSTGQAMNPVVYVMTLTGTTPLLDEAAGTEVKPSDTSLPSITIVDGKPAVDVPDSFTEPTELVVEPVIEGDGPTIEEGQTVFVKYTGWLVDGTQFDSSWDREAPQDILNFTTGAGQVIPGWDQGLIGQKVGSRLLLVIPADMGYGDQENGEIPADSTLIFAVDVLAAQ